jgi:MFS-type transporter involved in bile tolerance (Atg22 family)
MPSFRMPGAESPTARRLPWMMAGDALSGIFGMMTAFGPAFVLFLSALGLDKARIGVLLASFPLCAIIAVFVAPLVSRWGYKRTVLIFWGTRHLFMALVLFTPIVLQRYGLNAAFTWAACLLLAFGLFRAMAETGFQPWIQEIVPNSIRGKFSALNSIISTLAQMTTVALASRYIAGSSGTERYMVLIGVGSVIGACSVLCYGMVPGGAPAPDASRLTTHVRSMGAALRDHGYVLFLVAVFVLTVMQAALSFVVLFMKEQIGLPASTAMALSVAASAGAILSSYLWGWSADRHGSRPIMRISVAWMLVLPLSWILMPRQGGARIGLAFAVALMQGVTSIGWSLGSTRYLHMYSASCPQRVAYLTWCYVISQLASGFGPIIVGRLLNATQGLQGRVLGVRIDPYTPVFLTMLVCVGLGLLAITLLRRDTHPAGADAAATGQEALADQKA